MRPAIRNAALIATGVAVGITVAPPVAQAAINYFDTTKTVTSTGSASCPGGWKLTGGGAGPLPTNYYGSVSSDEYQLTGSYPSGNTWRATATRVHGIYSSSSGWRFSSFSYSMKVYAICVN